MTEVAVAQKHYIVDRGVWSNPRASLEDARTLARRRSLQSADCEGKADTYIVYQSVESITADLGESYIRSSSKDLS